MCACFTRYYGKTTFQYSAKSVAHIYPLCQGCLDGSDSRGSVTLGRAFIQVLLIDSKWKRATVTTVSQPIMLENTCPYLFFSLAIYKFMDNGLDLTMNWQSAFIAGLQLHKI